MSLKFQGISLRGLKDHKIKLLRKSSMQIGFILLIKTYYEYGKEK